MGEEPTKITANPTLAECEVLLGRELTPNEQANYTLFLGVAVARLNALLGCDVSKVERESDVPLVKLLLARLIGVVNDEQQAAMNYGVSAKSVEDFKVEYDENSSAPMCRFVELNADLLKLFAPKPVFRAGSNAYDGKALCI